MKTIRSLPQPGLPHPSRIDCFRGQAQELAIDLKPGLTLNEAITTPLVAAGFHCAAVTFKDAGLNPFRYVMPAQAGDDTHVAYFSAPRSPAGTTRVEHGNATFGWAAGKPFTHCHAAWIEPDGGRRGGHILPLETTVAEPGEAIAWGFRSIRVEAAFDPETNFTLFQPTGTTVGPDLVARIKPNEDILSALEAIAHTYGMANATVRGGVGSLIGASFTHGGQVEDIATEVLVREGHIRDGKAVLDLLVVDMRGRVHEGRIRFGENPVCITFELVLENVARASGG